MQKTTKQIRVIVVTIAVTFSGLSLLTPHFAQAGTCIKCTTQQGSNKDQCIKYQNGTEWCDPETIGTDCCGNLNPT